MKWIIDWAKVITIILTIGGGLWKIDDKIENNRRDLDGKIENNRQESDQKIGKLDDKIENNRRESDQKWAMTIQKDMGKKEGK